MNSKIQTRCTYRDYKLKSHFGINKSEFKKVFYTKHISYWKGEQNKKALNFVKNSMPFYFDQIVKKLTEYFSKFYEINS